MMNWGLTLMIPISRMITEEQLMPSRAEKQFQPYSSFQEEAT